MALPINISDLINRRVIESARINIKGPGIRNRFCIPFVLLQMILTTGAAVILLSVSMRRMECRNSLSED